jgi:hypothetical protein
VEHPTYHNRLLHILGKCRLEDKPEILSRHRAGKVDVSTAVAPLHLILDSITKCTLIRVDQVTNITLGQARIKRIVLSGDLASLGRRRALKIINNSLCFLKIQISSQNRPKSKQNLTAVRTAKRKKERKMRKKFILNLS